MDEVARVGTSRHAALHAAAANLIYTGITRAKRLLVVVGQKKALGLAVRNDQSRKRYSGLLSCLKETSR
jgi:exodeoxyribonuclease V alpha subunit